MSFREWTEELRENVRGNQPNWPWLLGYALEDEFRRQRAVNKGYSGDVFKDRDDVPVLDGKNERPMVSQLYHACLQNNSGCLTIGEETFWLLGYEWPNQGGDAEKGRRADLIGLTNDGGLVVFECKLPTNPDPPFTALTEGLDYLSCLMRPLNFDNIIKGFRQWLQNPGKTTPDTHPGIEPQPEAKPAIIVLAPNEYFTGRYTRSKRGDGWADFAAIGNDVCPSFRIGFAASDFQSTKASWV